MTPNISTCIDGGRSNFRNNTFKHPGFYLSEMCHLIISTCILPYTQCMIHVLGGKRR